MKVLDDERTSKLTELEENAKLGVVNGREEDASNSILSRESATRALSF
jgi:hypothetical protein